MLRFCESDRVRFLAHTPLGPRLTEGALHRVRDADSVRRIAAARGVSPEVAALAWLLALSPQMMVIPGARQPAIRDSILATTFQLSESEFADLSRVPSSG